MFLYTSLTHFPRETGKRFKKWFGPFTNSLLRETYVAATAAAREKYERNSICSFLQFVTMSYQHPTTFQPNSHSSLLLTPSELKTAPTSRDICFCCFWYRKCAKSKNIFACCYFSLILFNMNSLLWQKANRMTPVQDPTQMETGLLRCLPKTGHWIAERQSKG